MKRWSVLVYASEEIEVEAETVEEAEELAAEESKFDVVDYCEVSEVEEQEE